MGFLLFRDKIRATAIRAGNAALELIARGRGAAGLAVLSAENVYAGPSILSLCGCRAATKGAFTLTKKITLKTRNRFIGKEATD